MKRYLTLLLSLLFVLPLPAQSRREALLEYQARRRQAYTEFRDNYRKACATSCASAGRLSAPRLRYPCPNAGNPMSPL